MRPARLLPALLALALAALLPLLARPTMAADPPVYAPVGPGDVYLALGDSLATGEEASANNDALAGYPALLYTTLNTTRPIAYRNLGVSGETSTSMRSPGGQLAQALAFIAAEQAAGRRVSPVTLSIGGNDMVGTFLGQNPATITDTLPLFRANIAQILDSLIAANTLGGQRQGDLIVMNYYNPYPDLTITEVPGLIDLAPGQGPIVTNIEVPRFNQVISEEAAARGVPVVDAYGAFRGREASLTFVRFPYNFFDRANIQRNFDYHPREAGHHVLARGFAVATGYTLKLPQVWLPLLRQ